MVGKSTCKVDVVDCVMELVMCVCVVVLTAVCLCVVVSAVATYCWRVAAVIQVRVVQ